MSGTIPSQTPQAPQAPDVSLKKYPVRIALGGTIVAIVTAHVTLHDPQTIDFVIISLIAAYFCATGLWQRRVKNNTPGENHLQIGSIDALIVSAAATYYINSIGLILLLALPILFNASTNASPRQSLSDFAMLLLGAGLVAMITPISWQFNIDSVSLGLAIIGLLAYLSVFAYYIRKRIKKLNVDCKRLYSDLVLQKVRSYKLSRYVTPTVWSSLNQGKDASLKTDRKRVTVFFSDIAGFSSLSEELEAEVLTDLLNTYLTEMVKIAAKHKGTIDKFMGDGLMVLFGDTSSDGMKTDCMRCIAMAMDMRKKMKELEIKWFNQGIKQTLQIRMGINSGYCTVGTFGTSEYMEYTALGTHVNLASRLESAAESGEILISHETWSLIKDVVMCRDRGEIKAKGFSHPIKVYQVINFRKELGSNQSYFEEHAPGFSMHIDLEKVKNYERSRIVEQLETIAEKLRDKI